MGGDVGDGRAVVRSWLSLLSMAACGGGCRWLVGSEGFEVAVQLPAGDLGAVLVPLGPLRRDVVGQDVVAEGLGDDRVALELVDRLAERARAARGCPSPRSGRRPSRTGSPRPGRRGSGPARRRRGRPRSSRRRRGRCSRTGPGSGPRRGSPRSTCRARPSGRG